MRRPAGLPAVVLVAAGYLVHSCLEAAAALEQRGIAAVVVDAYSLPLDAGRSWKWPEARMRGGARGRGQLRGRARQRVGRGVGRACGAGYGGDGGAAPAEERPHPDDVLGYVGLSVPDIAAAAERLVQRVR